ncbi:MAG: helix-turn-helix domain-containing protein [Janthinobacterium lividum]
MSDLPSRLRSARIKAGYKSARSAAIRFGWGVSTYAAHENGQNSFDAEQAVLYAKAFKANPSWLYFGEGRYPTQRGGYVYSPSGFVYELGKVSQQIKSLKNKVITYTLFADMPEDIVIYELLDSSLWPQYDKSDLLICRPVNIKDDHNFIGSEAVVELQDGSVILRQVEAAREKNRFNLVSQKLPLMRDVAITRAWMKVACIARVGYSVVMTPPDDPTTPRLEDSPSFKHE